LAAKAYLLIHFIIWAVKIHLLLNFKNEGKSVMFVCEPADKILNDWKYLHFSFPCFLIEVNEGNLRQKLQEYPIFVEQKVEEESNREFKKENINPIEVVNENIEASQILSKEPEIPPISNEEPLNDTPLSEPAPTQITSENIPPTEPLHILPQENSENSIKVSKPVGLPDNPPNEAMNHSEDSQEPETGATNGGNGQSDEIYSYDSEVTNDSSSPYLEQLAEREKLWQLEREKQRKVEVFKRMHEEFKKRTSQT
jgi:hypothetical protein